jgi:hypothetical protein
MSQIKKIILSILVAFLCISIINGQSAIPATGGNASGPGGSSSYTIGQVVFNTIGGAAGTVIQGVQQPYEISVVTALEKTEDITLECIVYPNPTRNTIKLFISSYEDNNMRFRLVDINGVLLQDEKIESKETDISMERFSPAVYFLKIMKGNMEIKTFKVIKN